MIQLILLKNSSCYLRYIKATEVQGKTGKHILFEVELNRLAAQTGVLSAGGIHNKVKVTSPAVFGGDGNEWSPEQLLLGAVSSSFMNTYLAFAKTLQLEISHFECNTIGQVEVIEGKYKFTQIDVYPKVYISKEFLRDKARVVLEKTHHHCLITRSLNALVYYHSEILIADISSSHNSAYTIHP